MSALLVGALLSLTAAIPSTQEPVETAVVVLMRHGEKTEESGNGLSPDGVARSPYIAKCLGGASLTSATPLGPVSSLMASATREGKSHRTRDTLQPLADARALTLHYSIDKKDFEGLQREARQHLKPGGTLVIAWQHEELPSLVRALAPFLHLHHMYKDWPETCDSLRWPEPPNVKGVRCYDALWQITMSRKVGGGPADWDATAVNTLHMGFGGAATSSCAEGFAPISRSGRFDFESAPEQVFRKFRSH